MNSSDCIFCRIVNNELPCFKVYEDSDFIAFLDIRPANRGHCLIVPKKHYENLLDFDEELLNKMMPVVKKVASAVKKATKADAFNILLNNGKEAGQEVNHVHIHLIPRFKGDQVNISWGRREMSNKELEETTSSIKRELE